MRNTVESYGPVARGLHWAIGLLLISQVLGGIYAFEFMERSADRSALIGVHKALGVILLLLVLVRLAWRLYDAAPALPAALPERLKQFARMGHGALYAFMVLLPISGVLIGAYADRPTDVFGLFVIPAFFEANEPMHELFEGAHKYGGWAFGVFVLGHIALALWHKFMRKDGVAERML